MDSVAKTSLLTAAMRAVETKRSDSEGRLFSDPFAELLAGKEGFDILEKAIQAAGDQPAIAIRTAFVDLQIEKAIKNGVRQFVFLAAGMDSRAYRLDFPFEAKIYELDRKEVFEYKNEKLKDAKLKCNRQILSVDLNAEWTKDLLDSGFKKDDTTFWLVEGLLMYLSESQVLKVFNKINSLSSINDYLVFDILSLSLIKSPFMQNQLKFLEGIGAPWYFGVDEPEEFMEKLGWRATATQAGEFAPNRWPFPVAPRNIPNLPRGFYVDARKF